MNIPSQSPKINLVSLIRRTLAKVFETAGLQENEPTVRTLVTCLLHVAGDYTRALGDDPVHAEKLFRAFATGTPEQIQAAVKAFGEAFQPVPESIRPVTHRR